ncbi:MAG TPA: FHA domain-containing protein, partial [Polyangiaceae bacterium]|nr:FHA domain-containing protein [Polyangiaceae bacterium]
MVDKTTGAMQAFGAPAAPGAHSRSGLVLLYTQADASLPGAILLEQERQVIGRDEGVEICLPVTAVSRRHAEISWERGAWVLRDLGSRNGIIMEGRQVVAEELKAGNEIRIGDAVFKFVDKHAE